MDSTSKEDLKETPLQKFLGMLKLGLAMGLAGGVGLFIYRKLTGKEEEDRENAGD
jgi:hypothetical protein